MTNHEKSVMPSFMAPKPIRLAIKLLEKVAPKAAAKKAIDFFFTPLKFPTPEREESFKHSCIISREAVNGKPITIYHLGKGEKKVLFVHGWSGRATQFYQIAPELKKAGYKVFAFTAPAHGSSKDKHTHMLEFADSIRYINEKYGPFDAILGHSIGGAAILNAINQGVETQKVVLLGTPGYIKDIVIDFCLRLGCSVKTEKAIIAHLKTKYGEDFEQHSTTRLAEKMSIPRLIIHDQDDKDVAVSCARENHKKWKNSSYYETKGLGHRLILSDETVIQEIKNFLIKP